jgi:sugar lactone lactonase YvrE
MTVSRAAGEVLGAVIDDARRHARFRRRRNGAIVVVTLLLAIVVIAHFRSGGSPHPAASASVPSSARVHNGAIAILGGGTGPTDGWYGVSRIGADGSLHPFVRCPHHAKWCGEPESLAWTARGDRLALSVTSFGSANPYNGLHVIDMRSRTDTQIRTCNDPPGECDWFDLAWSPDAKTIAYVSSGNIILVDADGSHRRLLPTPAGRKSAPAWSPDGRAIAFADELDRARVIYRVDIDGSHLRLLARHATAPAWSRSGVIAYHTDCGIQLMTGNGKPVRPRGARACGAIGLAHLATPVWSPDGTRIAATLSRRRPNPTRGTYLMNADGTHVTRLTTATLSVFIGAKPRVAWQPAP